MLDFTLVFTQSSGDIGFTDTSDYSDYTNIVSSRVLVYPPEITVDGFSEFILLGTLLK